MSSSQSVEALDELTVFSCQCVEVGEELTVSSCQCVEVGEELTVSGSQFKGRDCTMALRWPYRLTERKTPPTN